jgi:hypothetical protein
MNCLSHTTAETLNLFNDPSFVAVPIPVSNPAIGTGGAAAGALLFRFVAAAASVSWHLVSTA